MTNMTRSSQTLIILAVLLLAALFPTGSTRAQDGEQADPAREALTLPITLYRVVDDAEEPSPTWSTARSEEELREMVDGMNEIWAQADIQFEIEAIHTLELPTEVIAGLMAGDFRPFFEGAGSQFDLPDFTLVNGFYAKSIGGPNGIMPFGAPLYFVTDEPSVYDHRVSSHEVGHILGLYHVITDREHLMSSGVNGMRLDEDEQVVARYMARGMLAGLR